MLFERYWVVCLQQTDWPFENMPSQKSSSLRIDRNPNEITSKFCADLINQPAIIFEIILTFNISGKTKRNKFIQLNWKNCPLVEQTANGCPTRNEFMAEANAKEKNENCLFAVISVCVCNRCDVFCVECDNTESKTKAQIGSQIVVH